MYYAPHTLYVAVPTAPQTDSFGRLLEGESEWQQVCVCRCDDNGEQSFTTDAGRWYRPSYHVVCEGQVDVRAGQRVRCLDGSGAERGAGIVFKVAKTNWYNYTEIWI